MTDDIQSMKVSGYLCTLTSAGLVGIESSRNIYVPTNFNYSHSVSLWGRYAGCCYPIALFLVLYILGNCRASVAAQAPISINLRNLLVAKDV